MLAVGVNRQGEAMHILVVEDDELSRDLFKTQLEFQHHRVTAVASAEEGWDLMCARPADIVLSDWQLPGMDGLALCHKIRSADFPNYVYLMLTSGKGTQRDIVCGLQGGIDDYIAKPVDYDELRARIEIGVRILLQERELKRRYQDIEDNYYQTLRMFGDLIAMFDDDLGGHSRRTARHSIALARRHPGVPEADHPVIEAAGLLHDIGMVGLPVGLLDKKRTEMTHDEQVLYRSHPAQGEAILKEIGFLKPVAKLVGMHHEQVNGKGFPAGLKADQIPAGAQIVSAASIYDNLIHRGGVALEKIPESLQRFRGYLLSAELVDLLIAVNQDQILKAASRTDLKIGVDRLTSGMVLSKSVRLKNGALVLPAGTPLDGHGITKLQRYLKMDVIHRTAFVCKPIERG
jgi:putative two-component system response regulator